MSEFISYAQIMRNEIHEAVMRVCEVIAVDPKWHKCDERMLGIPAEVMHVENILLSAFDRYLNEQAAKVEAAPEPQRPQFSLYEGQALREEDRK
jgi:hypothetical protein